MDMVDSECSSVGDSLRPLKMVKSFAAPNSQLALTTLPKEVIELEEEEDEEEPPTTTSQTEDTNTTATAATTPRAQNTPARTNSAPTTTTLTPTESLASTSHLTTTTITRTTTASSSSSSFSSSSSLSSPSTSASSLLAPFYIATEPKFTSSSFTYADDQSILNQHLVCSLCAKTLVRPLQHIKCGSLFCTPCLNDAKDPQCNECSCVIRSKELLTPAKPIRALLDSLIVKCSTCGKTLPRKEYEHHWSNECNQPCPFASHGCTTELPRTALNAHIDACDFAPVACEAASFGCTWNGKREAAPHHATSCHLHTSLPVLHALETKRLAEVRARDHEIASLKEALATVSQQLRSYRDLGIDVSSTMVWKAGTLIDALDTEDSWLIAQIKRVDMAKRLYLIHYIDWDVSWDELIPFNSPRLAPAGTHTTPEQVQKHLKKVLADGITPEGAPAGPATPDVLHQFAQRRQSVKRKG